MENKDLNVDVDVTVQNDATEPKKVGEPADSAVGAFMNTLTRTNKQIKKDRAESISEDTELTYSRKIQDMRMEIKKLKRERANMLDLSPTNTQSLMLANDFNASEFVKRDIEIGVKLRNLEITLEIAENQFLFLFGKEVN